MKYLDIEVITRLDLSKLAKGTLTKYWLHIISSGIAQPVYLPIMVAKGATDGPVLGITAAVHGNELNGISIIHEVFNNIDVNTLRGTVVGVPVMNIPSIINQERHFVDGEDLNRIMPGKADGSVSQVYVHRFIDRVISEFEYLLDLHTASFGRVNSYYIRADLKRKITSKMAEVLNAEIILNNEGSDGTLRSAAANLGIHAVTIEVGDPNQFQKGMIDSGLAGTLNVMRYLKMIEGEVIAPKLPAVICKKSKWLYANRGGILEVFPEVTQKIKKGDKIAIVRDIFGDIINTYNSPEEGIIIGKNVHPVSQTGGRIIHLGTIK